MQRPASTAIGLVHDEREPELVRRLAAQLGMVPIPLKSASGATLRGMQGVVYSIDLANHKIVAKARQGLAAAGTHGPLIFAVDNKEGYHRSRIQANALGATMVLRRPLEPEKVRIALRELGLLVPEAAPTLIEARPSGVSVKAAAQVLNSAFSALKAGSQLDVRQSIQASRQLLDGVGKVGLNSWLETVRDYHEGTFQHCLLVTGAAVAYARQAQLSERDQLELSVAALLHDIGKAEIPLEILDKPGRLTDAEFDIVKRHPTIGRDYLRQQKTLPAAVLSAVTHHHEYLDGSGYPDGLKGDEIDLVTRILTVCDVYGALAERRSYKEPKTPQEAILILVDMADRGKVEYDIVRTLGTAVGVVLPEGRFRLF